MLGPAGRKSRYRGRRRRGRNFRANRPDVDTSRMVVSRRRSACSTRGPHAGRARSSSGRAHVELARPEVDCSERRPVPSPDTRDRHAQDEEQGGEDGDEAGVFRADAFKGEGHFY